MNAALADTDQSLPEVLRAITEVKGRIEDASARLANVGPLVPVPGLAWPTDVLRRRALIGLVVERVTIAPAPNDGSGFSPERVRITPKGYA